MNSFRFQNLGQKPDKHAGPPPPLLTRGASDTRFQRGADLLPITAPLISDAAHRAYTSAVRVTQRLTQSYDHIVYRALIQELVLSPKHIQDLVATDYSRTTGD